MNEEKKEYSVVGTVTIGTDEYRDLIEECKRLEYELDEVNEKKRDLYWENISNKDKVKKLEEIVKTYKAYIDDGHMDSFRLWQLEQMKGEDTE